jgi:hypothetical protein
VFWHQTASRCPPVPEFGQALGGHGLATAPLRRAIARLILLPLSAIDTTVKFSTDPVCHRQPPVGHRSCKACRARGRCRRLRPTRTEDFPGLPARGAYDELMRCLVAVALLGACTFSHEVEVSLGDLAKGNLKLSTTRDASDVHIDLGFAISECPRLDAAVTGTLDGVQLRISSRGGYIGGIPDCETPRFVAFSSPSATATSEIVLTDAVTTVTVTVAALRVVRAFSVVGTPHPGSDVRFQWSVPTDTVPNYGSNSPRPGVLWTSSVGSPIGFGPGFGSDGVSLDGTTLVASLPSTIVPGAGTFDFTPLLGPTITRCIGIGRCTVVPTTPGSLDATIAP